MPATAADVPIELYDLILSFFTRFYYSTPQENRQHIQVDKRQLGSISLVCRDWAVACQPKIFELVILQDREDLDMLLHLMAHPTSRIARYIVDISCDLFLFSPSTPWLRTVGLRLLPRLPSSPTISVSLHGPPHPGQRITSVINSPPRRLPSGILRIQRLSLTKVHFEQFRDLLRLLGEIPSLSDVSCCEVTWNAPLGDQLPVPISFVSRPSGYCTYTFDRCTDNAAGAWLQWLLPPSKTCRLRVEDAHALCRTASALVKNVDADRFPEHWGTSMRKGNILKFYALNALSLTPTARVYLTSAGTSEWITSLEVDFTVPSEISVTEMIAHSDWTAIDEQIATLRDLDAVSLRFSTFQNLLAFARDAVAPKMLRLSGSTKLAYAVLRGMDGSENPWTWYMPETIQLELAKEPEKHTEQLQAVEKTDADGSSAEPCVAGMMVEDYGDNAVAVPVRG